PFPKGERSGAFVTLASGLPEDTDALPIRANARLVAATLNTGQSTEHEIAAGRKAYLVPATGKIEVNGVVANAGDGVGVRDDALLTVSALQDSGVVVVDVV